MSFVVCEARNVGDVFGVLLPRERGVVGDSCVSCLSPVALWKLSLALIIVALDLIYEDQ